MRSPPTERAMAETYAAHYVSLHVRVSNTAALHLYRDTLGFSVEKTEPKYYADGEDAFSMRMELGGLREQMRLQQDDEEEEKEEVRDGEKKEEGEDGAAGDEGDDVGSLGKKGEGADSGKKAAPGQKKRKVKVGRGLGVGDLVERNESPRA